MGAYSDPQDAASLRGTSEGSASPGFDSWRQVDANRWSIVFVRATAQTDGATRGRIRLLVDQSGGTTSDFHDTVWASDDFTDGTNITDGMIAILTAGAQYRIDNTDDPNAANTINNVRETVL